MKCYRMCCHLSRFCQDRLSQNSRHHLKSCLILYSTGTVWTPFFLKLPFAVSIEVWCMDPVFPQTAFSFSVNGLAPPGRLKRQKNGSGELHPLYSTSNKPLKGTGCVLIFILCKRWVKIWCCPNKLERPTASWFCCHQYFHCVMTPGCEQGPHNFLGLKTCLQNFTPPAHLRIVHTFYSHTQKKSESGYEYEYEYESGGDVRLHSSAKVTARTLKSWGWKVGHGIKLPPKIGCLQKLDLILQRLCNKQR